MKKLSIKAHAVIDYILGAITILSPWLFGFADVIFARASAWAFGAGLIFFAAITKYGFGIVNIINHRFHMIVDLILGVALATSPWALGFSNISRLPHLILGLVVIFSVLITEKAALDIQPEQLNKRVQ